MGDNQPIRTRRTLLDVDECINGHDVTDKTKIITRFDKVMGYKTYACSECSSQYLAKSRAKIASASILSNTLRRSIKRAIAEMSEKDLLAICTFINNQKETN